MARKLWLPVVCLVVWLVSPATAVPLVKMQFTSDVAGSSPSVATATAGGVSTKPTSFSAPAGTSVKVRSSPEDSITHELFELSNVIELSDTSTSSEASLMFSGNQVDVASGSDRVRIDMDIMVDSATANAESLSIYLRDPNNLPVLSMELTSNGALNLYSVDEDGNPLGTVGLGFVARGASFHLQAVLDYASGSVSFRGDDLLYAAGDVAYTKTVTGSFAKNRALKKLEIASTAACTGKFWFDNISIVKVRQLPTATVESFGAVGDGVTDDTAAIRLALRALGFTISKLTFAPNKTYLISETLDNPATVDNPSTPEVENDESIQGCELPISESVDFEIDGQNATIKVKNGTPVDYHHRVLDFVHCENFTVRNLTVDANRANRVPQEVYAYNILVSESNLFRFINVKAINAVTDGFLVTSMDGGETISLFPRNGLFQNCSATNAWRNGLTVANGHHIIIAGGSYSHTNGSGDPDAGIDLEDDAQKPYPCFFDVLIRNAVFNGNHGPGVQVAGKGAPRNITIEDCTFADAAYVPGQPAVSKASGILFGGAPYSVVRNNFFENYYNPAPSPPNQIGVLHIWGASSKFYNNWFKNIQTGYAALVLSQAAGTNNEIKGNVVINCAFAPAILIAAPNGNVISGNASVPTMASLAPVGYWPLNQSSGTLIPDASGNGINGASFNNPTWVAGQIGNALSFAGSNHYGKINDSALLDVTDHFTLSARMKADAASNANSHIVIGKQDDFRFGYSGGSEFGFYSSGTGWVTTSVSKGVWHQVAVTFNGRRLRLYVDGALRRDVEVRPSSMGTAYQVHIGSFGGTTYPFHGVIDEVRVYKHVLSASEIPNL